MESFTIELVLYASAQFPDNTLNSFANFLPEQLNLECQGEVAFSEISYPSMYPNVTEEKFMFFDKKFSTSSEFTIWNQFFNLPLRILLKRCTLSFKKDTITAKTVSQLKCLEERKKLRLTLQMKDLVLHFLVLGHIFGSNVGNKLGVMLRGKGPPKPEIAYDIVRTHSLMVYTDLIEYNIVGDTKAPLLRCFSFIAKLKAGVIITTGQYMNYKTFSNLQFRRLLKNSFHSIHIDLRDTISEQIPFVSVGITRLVLMFPKASNIHF